jgi:RNA polymerase sigma factor (sigma-70 family)
MTKQDRVLHLRTQPESRPKNHGVKYQVVRRCALAGNPDWRALIAGLRQGDEKAILLLVQNFHSGIRSMVFKQLGPTATDDVVQTCLLEALSAVACNHIENPEKLPAYIRTIVRRCTAKEIQRLVVARKGERITEECIDAKPEIFSTSQPDPEALALQAEKRRLAALAMSALRLRDREVLRRFYMFEQSEEEISSAMGTSSAQFRNLKQRARMRIRDEVYRAINKHASLNGNSRSAIGECRL